MKLASHFHMAQHLSEAGDDGLDHASLCKEAQASDVRRVDICLQGSRLWIGMEQHFKVLT